jgi:hypothetical protein
MYVEQDTSIGQYARPKGCESGVKIIMSRREGFLGAEMDDG